MLARLLVIGLMSFVGCVAEIGDVEPPAQTGADAGDSLGDDPEAPLNDADEDGVVNVVDNCMFVANGDQGDADGDRLGDACDCDPADADNQDELVYRLNPATAMNDLTPPEGFAAASWSAAATGIEQRNLSNDSNDGLLLSLDVPDGDFVVYARAASTEIADFDATDLRQVMLLAGASDDAGTLTGVGCGIEVVEGLTPTQQTSVIRLQGSAQNLTSTAIDRQPRGAVKANELFDLTLAVTANTIECTSVLASGEVTRASAANVDVRAGAVGLLTRESKALFAELRVCAR